MKVFTKNENIYNVVVVLPITLSHNRGKNMARAGTGSIFRRTDGKLFVYLPQAVAEDTAFPFSINSSTKVNVRFTEDGTIVIEPINA